MKPDRNIEGFDHIIREAVGERIEASIAIALESESNRLVETIVKTALNEKVKRGYRDLPFLEAISRDAIQAATQEAVKEWAEANVATIKAEVEKQLGQKSTQRQIAVGLIDAFARSTKYGHSIKIDFEIDTKDDR